MKKEQKINKELDLEFLDPEKRATDGFFIFVYMQKRATDGFFKNSIY